MALIPVFYMGQGGKETSRLLGSRDAAGYSLSKQVCHALQADAQGGGIVQQRGGRRRQNAHGAQHDQHTVEAHDKAVVGAGAVLQLSLIHI